jgi:hypothetical protein
VLPRCCCAAALLCCRAAAAARQPLRCTCLAPLRPHHPRRCSAAAVPRRVGSAVRPQRRCDARAPPRPPRMPRDLCCVSSPLLAEQRVASASVLLLHPSDGSLRQNGLHSRPAGFKICQGSGARLGGVSCASALPVLLSQAPPRYSALRISRVRPDVRRHGMCRRGRGVAHKGRLWFAGQRWLQNAQSGAATTTQGCAARVRVRVQLPLVLLLPCGAQPLPAGAPLAARCAFWRCSDPI